MNDYWNDTPALRERLNRVSILIEKIIRDPAFPLHEEVAQMLLSQGKMLRPALLIIGSGFGRGLRGAASTESIERLAAAIELLHAATLIHDDVLDNATQRRGLPTLHTRFGTVEAVLAGDWLLSRCFSLAAENTSPDNARLLARLVGSICSAEITQDLGKFSFHTSPRRYTRTIAGKTAALFSLALHAGSSETKARPEHVRMLRRAGYCMGMAFQIIDDILDYESETRILGKPAGNDLREGLCTLPLIFAMQRDPSGMADLTKGLKESSGAVPRIMERCTELGALDAARAVARLYTDRAEREIKKLPDRQPKTDLITLSRKLLSREY